MNINGVSTGTFSQNVINVGERGGRSAGSNVVPVSETPLAIQRQETKTSAQTLVLGISYLKDELDKILTSYPPFFPVGSYQRPDLIKRIKSLEEQIGKSAISENIKQMFSKNTISKDASDFEISTSLNRLFAAKDQLTAKADNMKKPTSDGSLVDIQV